MRKSFLLVFVLDREKENRFLCNPVTPLASSKWCFMSVTVRNCGRIVCVLRCLCHSLLFTALFFVGGVVFLLVLSIECGLCFVSPVKMTVHNKMVPVDGIDSILPSRWAINGAVNFKNITAFVWGFFF